MFRLGVRCLLGNSHGRQLHNFVSSIFRDRTARTAPLTQPSCMLRVGSLRVTKFKSNCLSRRPVRIESHISCPIFTRFRYTFAVHTPSLTMDYAARLSALSVTPHSVVSHATSHSPAAWQSSLSTAKPPAPPSYELTKTLVFKPKTAKNAIPVPVVVVMRGETEMNSAALGKMLKLKELRLASEDLLKEFFALDKDSCTLPFMIFTCLKR
jgi:Aminoacyl-tRNA editing domain